MKSFLFSACLILTPATLSFAQAPISPTKVAPVELIVAGMEDKVETLEKLLADPEKYDDNEEFIVRAGGVLACFSQALIEHEGRSQTKIAAPTLRDAGLALQDYAGHEACVKELQTIKTAMKGEATGEHEDEHPWDELIGMYDMMEEMNDRNGGLSRSLLRTRGKVEEQLNASTNAILGLAMMADHSYLEEDSQAEQWDKWAKDGQQAMTNLIGAIKEKDKAKIAEFYKISNHSCDQCHEVFRAE